MLLCAGSLLNIGKQGLEEICEEVEDCDFTLVYYINLYYKII